MGNNVDVLIHAIRITSKNDNVILSFMVLYYLAKIVIVNIIVTVILETYIAISKAMKDQEEKERKEEIGNRE